MTKRISYITAALVVCLTILSLVLSFNALRSVAFDHGLSDWRAFVWPLTIDFALIVFSLSVVSALLTRQSTWLRWLMVGLFTFATLAFNVADVDFDSLPDNHLWFLPYLVMIMPPLAFVLSFETLMAMLRSGVQRGELSETLDDLSGQQSEIMAEIDALKLKRTRLKANVVSLEDKIEAATVTKRQERLSQIPANVKAGMSPAAIAEAYGVSERTIYRDLDELELTDNGNK